MPPTRHPADDALTQARQAKDELVATHGIGSELAPTIYAHNTHGQGIAVLIKRLDRHQQEHHITAALMALADGMNIHTATIVKEGYAALRGTEHDTRPLAVRFASGDKTVSECLTALTVDTNGNTTITIQPYTIGLGRTITWDTEPDTTTTNGEPPIYSRHLHAALTPDTPTTIEEALVVLDDLGFAAMWADD